MLVLLPLFEELYACFIGTETSRNSCDIYQVLHDQIGTFWAACCSIFVHFFN